MKMGKKKFDKVNHHIMEMISEGLNPFSFYTNNKKKYNLAWYLECRDFTKFLSTVSPSFNLLWCMADYIHMLEIVYMYKNTDEADVYSFMVNKSGVRSFRINHLYFYIEYTLYEDSRDINITVKRHWSKKADSSITFPDGQAILSTRADEILMYNIIEWTMTPIRDLFIEYYKKAKEVRMP